MQKSDGEESRVLREGGVRGEDEGVPSQPLCVYLNGQHDGHGKATKGFSTPKRDIKKTRRIPPRVTAGLQPRVAWWFPERASRLSLVHSTCGQAAKKSYFKLVSDWVTPRVAR